MCDGAVDHGLKSRATLHDVNVVAGKLGHLRGAARRGVDTRTSARLPIGRWPRDRVSL
jgi:hypothetical protein